MTYTPAPDSRIRRRQPIISQRPDTLLIAECNRGLTGVGVVVPELDRVARAVERTPLAAEHLGVSRQQDLLVLDHYEVVISSTLRMVQNECCGHVESFHLDAQRAVSFLINPDGSFVGGQNPLRTALNSPVGMILVHGECVHLGAAVINAFLTLGAEISRGCR